MRSLLWRSRGWLSWSFDLMEGQQRLASLEQKRWSMNATLSVEGREEDLKLAGLFRWTVTLRDREGRTLATMPIGWRGQGDVTLADGRRFRWRPDNFWGTRFVLEDPERGWRARVHMDRFLKMDARVEVDDGGPDEATLLRALSVAWYCAVVTMQSASSAGTTAAIT